jgi:ribosomal protein S12 methylthiotransferase accessory factor
MSIPPKTQVHETQVHKTQVWGAPPSLRRLRQACGLRCGLIMPPQRTPKSRADLPGYYSWAVPADPAYGWMSGCGALAVADHDAEAGAIAETLERYCAGIARFPVLAADELPPGSRRLDHETFALYTPEQQVAPGFPWPREAFRQSLYAEVFSLRDNEPAWAPQELVGMGSRRGAPAFPSTSSGLAAHTDTWLALLRAVQELLERDALTITWLNSLGGRQFDLPAALHEPVAARGGEVYAFDLTQRWNPHPVAAVCGSLPSRGRPRIALGAACRETLGLACEKAFQEWLQGVEFAGQLAYGDEQANRAFGDAPASFEEHALYYSLHPERWPQVPLLRHRRFVERETAAAVAPIPPDAPRPEDVLKPLLDHLGQEGVELFYRDLTTADVRDAGLGVMRVLSPQLSLLHGDERYPFLGGRARDVLWRYPDLASRSNGLNPYPHPLG